jgi:hypothetical protein
MLETTLSADNQESLSLTNVGLRPNFAVRACCKTRFRPRGITFDCQSTAQDPVRLAVRRATATSLGSRYSAAGKNRHLTHLAITANETNSMLCERPGRNGNDSTQCHAQSRRMRNGDNVLALSERAGPR